MVRIINRFIFYLIGLVIICSFIDNVFVRLINFLPYWISGLVIISPFYGVYKKINDRIKVEIRKSKSFKRYFLRLEVLIILSIIIFKNIPIIIDVFKTTALYSFVSFVILSVLWTAVRYILVSTKKVLIPSIIESYKYVLS